MPIKIIANAGINPTLLGVPDNWSQDDPRAQRMPPRLNPAAQKAWEAVLVHPHYKEQSKGMSSASKWSLAVQMFMHAAEQEGFDPFGNVLDQTDNNRIISLLTRARMKVCKYIDRTQLLLLLTVRDSWREVKLTDKGFILRSWAKATYEGGNMMDLENILRSAPFGFVPVASEKGRTLSVMVDPSVRMYVTLKNGGWVHIHYRMDINQQVYHPRAEKGQSITLPELRTWIERVLWMPVTRSHRFLLSNRKTLF